MPPPSVAAATVLSLQLCAASAAVSSGATPAGSGARRPGLAAAAGAAALTSRYFICMDELSRCGGTTHLTELACGREGRVWKLVMGQTYSPSGAKWAAKVETLLSGYALAALHGPPAVGAEAMHALQ